MLFTHLATDCYVYLPRAGSVIGTQSTENTYNNNITYSIKYKSNNNGGILYKTVVTFKQRRQRLTTPVQAAAAITYCDNSIYTTAVITCQHLYSENSIYEQFIYCDCIYTW